MFSFKNSANILIGKSVPRTANVQYTDPSATSTYIADGEIVVLNGDTGAPLVAGTTISTCRSIKVVQGRNNSEQPLVFSARMSGLNISSFDGVDGSLYPAQEQIMTIGYNGTTGSLDVASLDDYVLRITYLHDKLFWSEQKMIRSYYFSNSSPTQKLLATTNVADINNDPASMVSAEMFNSGAAASLGGASTLACNNNSNVVTASVNTHGLIAGDIVRIGTGALATTDPVYIVKSVSANGLFITLTFPFQGTTATYSNANVGEVTAGANWGFKLTGEPLKYKLGFFSYMKVIFAASLTNYGSSTTADVQTSFKGNGDWHQVQELEWMLTGYEGVLNRTMVPLDSLRTDAIQNTVYSTISISYYDTSENYPVSGTHPAPQMLYIFLPHGAAQNATLAAQLNPWMSSLPASFNPIPAL